MASGTSSHLAAIVSSGLVGLAVGSFLNVVAYRVPRGMSIVRPGSHCPSCGTPLTALDTVPVASWVVLRGRCRHCRAPVAVRYVVVEAVTGAAFAAVAATLGGLDPLPSIAVVSACAIAAAAVDADGGRVPVVLGAVAGAGAVSLVAVAVAIGQPGRIGWAAVGAAAAGAVEVVADGGLPSMGGWTTSAGRWAVLAALGGVAGWLWPAAAGIAAGWLVGANVAARRIGTGPARRVPLGALGAGVFAVVLAAAAVR